MKIAYLSFVTKEPWLMKEAMKASAHETIYFFLHLDKKSRFMEEDFIPEGIKVKFTKKRVDYKRSWFSTIEATLALLEESLKGNYDFFSLHSENDFPIKPIGEFTSFLEKNVGKSFMDFHKFTSKEWGRERCARIKYFYTNESLGNIGSDLLLKLQRTLGYERKFPERMDPYGGSQWWTISRPAAEYIMDFTNQNRKATEFFKNTLIPDEMFFQSILMNSDLAKNIENNNLRHIEWGADSCSHPRIFTMEDLPTLQKSGKYFARKFPGTDKSIIETLKKEL